MRRTIASTSIAVMIGAMLLTAASTGAAAPQQGSEQGLAGAVARADAAIAAHATDVRAATGDSFTAFRSVVDANGASHVRYNRTYQGLKVYGGDFVMHHNASGAYAGASVGLNAPLALSIKPAVSTEKAVAKSTAAVRGTIDRHSAPELVVEAGSGIGRLAWETVFTGFAPDGQTPSVLHVLIDARDGQFIRSWDEIRHVEGTGNTVYSGSVTVDTTASGGGYTLTDPVRGDGYTCDMNNGTGSCSTMNDSDNVWGNGSPSNDQSAAADAHYGAALTYDYFKNVHGRNGIFGNGNGVPSRVHYGNNYVNAFWDGSRMTYGDGDGNVNPLVSIDVAGHEMTHGITENVVPGGITYSGEPGGINEATSDIFGTMVEFFANNPEDPADYDIGEEIDIRGNGTPLRYMYNPGLDGNSHTCWSTNTKNVDVHYSSGPANHFVFNLAEGTGNTQYGTSPICGSADPVTGIGRDKAELIWYRSLDIYFTSNVSYINNSNPGNTTRAYTLRATTDLYGECSTEYRTVQAAWTAVNVAGNDAACPVGDDFSMSVSPASGSTDPGGSVSATVSTTITNGNTQSVDLSATGLPSGASASFSPSTVNSGDSAGMTISTSATTAAGSYSVTITGTGTAATRSTGFTLTVNGPPGCDGTNGDNYDINDNSTVSSPITISGCSGNASATAEVEVHIVHTYIGDLIVDLVAPDGTAYNLHNRSGGSANDINETYTVDLSSESADGTWNLRVSDNAGLDTGYIDSWTLSLGGGTPPSPTPSPTPSPGEEIVWEDDFESSTGWTEDPNGTDTASIGTWERGNPAGTSYSGTTLQLNNTTSGSNCLVTGAAAGSGAGSYDVDGGVTSMWSPSIALPSSGTLTLSYSWYLAHLNNASSADFFRVSIVHSGGTTELHEQLGAGNNRAGAWGANDVDISAYAGQSVRILIEAADASGGSLVEAGVDDVVVTKS